MLLTKVRGRKQSLWSIKTIIINKKRYDNHYSHYITYKSYCLFAKYTKKRFIFFFYFKWGVKFYKRDVEETGNHCFKIVSNSLLPILHHFISFMMYVGNYPIYKNINIWVIKPINLNP